MSDTAAKREISIKSKIVPKDIGNPKGATVLENIGMRHKLGTFFGIASRIVIRTLPTGETFEGLGGTFEAVPADGTKAILRSGITYLPAGIYETIAEQVQTEETDAKGESKVVLNEVRFAFDVYTVKATNAAGYEWSFVPLVQVSQSDPLAALRAEVAPALPAPKTEAPASEAEQPSNAEAPKAPAASGKK